MDVDDVVVGVVGGVVVWVDVVGDDVVPVDVEVELVVVGVVVGVDEWVDVIEDSVVPVDVEVEPVVVVAASIAVVLAVSLMIVYDRNMFPI